ncbi:MAG TPA: TSUP family transporter [Desulfomonilia bacterium]|nr:TSUP family transporter [Desulfomonilia bacterium]
MFTSIVFILIAIGLAAGILAGFFGIGGGIIIIPALIYILGFSQHRATGTSLAVLLPPIGIAAFIEYYRNGNVDIKAALIIAVFAIIGGGIGAMYANRLSEPMLRLLFSILMITLGGYMAIGAMRKLGWF